MCFDATPAHNIPQHRDVFFGTPTAAKSRAVRHLLRNYKVGKPGREEDYWERGRIGKKKVAANCFVAAQCPIPTHMAMHGDMGGKG